MTCLSEILKKYYEKKRDRLFFKNGMSLNNLALEMWERANYKGIDQSSLSKIINGKRLFTTEQLRIFCYILKLDRNQEKTLSIALEEDCLKRYGFKLYTLNETSTDIISLLNLNLKYLSDAREHGLLYLVEDWIDNLLEMILSSLKKEQNKSRKNELITILGNTLYEKGYISGCMSLPEKNMLTIRPIVSEMIKLARELQSSELIVKAYIVLSFAYYALGKYSNISQFKKYYLRSLSIIKRGIAQALGSDELNLICWRTVAINSIYLSDYSLFKKSEQNIREIVRKHKKNSKFSYIVWALDTVARGQSFFKDINALNTIFESKEFNKKIKWPDPLREASMIRNEIEILRNLKSKNESGYIKKRAEEGLIIATNYRFHRYKELFQNFMR